MPKSPIRIGLEHQPDGSVRAWGLDFPGCLAEAPDDTEAVLRFAQALLRHSAWLDLHADSPWYQLDQFDFRVAEAATAPSGFPATFHDDLRPLSGPDAERAVQIFTWQNEELLAGLESFTVTNSSSEGTALNQAITDALQQMAARQYQLLGRLGLPGAQVRPLRGDPLDAIQSSAPILQGLLLQPDGSTTATGNADQNWTTRKSVRCLLGENRLDVDRIRDLILGKRAGL